jgi:hypothetical protein
MKKLLVVVMAALFTLSMGGMVVAKEKAAVEEKAPAKKPSVTKERTAEVTATVEAIDLEKRVVTLKGPEGNLFDLKVGKRAKNLPQLKVGDLVTVKYYESLAVKVFKKGQAPQVEGATEGVVAAKPGKKPGGAAVSQVTVTATVEALDKKNQTVTLKGPEGKSVTVKVKDPKNMENVIVGDEVVITYSEALAISVKPAKKK